MDRELSNKKFAQEHCNNYKDIESWLSRLAFYPVYTPSVKEVDHPDYEVTK